MTPRPCKAARLLLGRTAQTVCAGALLLCLLAPGSSAWAQATPERPVVQVGLLFDGPWTRNEALRALFQTEIRELTEREFDVRFTDAHVVTADWTRQGVHAAVDRLLADPEVDVLITLGIIASQYVARMDSLPKPTLAPLTVDPALQGLPSQGNATGVPNLNYLTFPNTLQRDLEAFRRIVDFDRVMILSNEALVVPNIERRIEAIAAELGVQILGGGVGTSAGAALAAIPDGVDAVYLFPLQQLSPDAFETLVQGLIERRLPSFSYLGGDEVERGVLATLNPDVFPRLARRIALHTLDVLLGTDAGTLPITFLPGQRLRVNMETARALGVYPDWSVMLEAEVIYDVADTTEARLLNLERAMQEGVAANLALLAQDRVVAGGRHAVRQARSNLLPDVELSATGVIVDENRAETSFGTQPQRALSGAVTLRQVIYSDQALTGLAAARLLQEAREHDREVNRLDVALEVALTYLDVLRAQTLERIQFENVRVTRENLDLARIRESLGQSGPAEALRWESELATNRKNQIEASAQRRAAELALNQVRNRPLEEPFVTQESLLDDPAQLLVVFSYLPYVRNPQLFNIFRNFMAREGLVNAPELEAFDAAIAAQERVHASTRRAFWSPTVGLQAGLTSRLASGGAGTGGLPLPPEFSAAFPEGNDAHWNVGVNLTFPLFRGFARVAERGIASEELARLRTERELARDRIEQRIRTAVELAGGSFGSIAQARQAAEAAEQTRRLVTDAYARGAVSILDLLDAQNAALVTSEVAANAVYDFLKDLMRTQRSIGRFDVFRTAAERADFEARMDAFFRAAGIEMR